MRVILILILITLSLKATEPSAFKAGDLDLNEPYGLTESEKKINENKKTVKKLNRNYASVTQRTEANSKDIEGLRTMIEALQSELLKTRKELAVAKGQLGIGSSDTVQIVEKVDISSEKNDSTINLISEPNLNSKKTDSIPKKIDDLENFVKQSNESNQKNYQTIMAAIKKVSKNVESNYMTKKEANSKFDSLIKFLKSKIK